MDKIAGSKNDECYTPLYAIEPLLKYLKKGSKIWCPFDTEDSYYVKLFKKEGFDVIATHIFNDQDFFELDIDCDYIISNPPYSLKKEVFKRLFSLNKPFAMLVGVVGLFESQQRFEMFKNNNFEIMYFNLRVSFYRDYNDKYPSANPPFSSAYVCQNILPNRIMFEKINKKQLRRK